MSLLRASITSSKSLVTVVHIYRFYCSLQQKIYYLISLLNSNSPHKLNTFNIEGRNFVSILKFPGIIRARKEPASKYRQVCKNYSWRCGFHEPVLGKQNEEYTCPFINRISLIEWDRSIVNFNGFRVKKWACRI